jgi:pimeloyl-ACP methyl ester carboxylesterase
MREYPVFVPYQGEHVAAIVTVPDHEEPRGLVVLSTGLGATRSHRFQVWTTTARTLADRHALAVVRWEYLGIGDSTADTHSWGLANLPVGEALAVTRFAMDAVGADRFATAGNCVGSWMSISLAARMPECIGSALLRMPVLAPDSLTLLRRRAQGSRLVRMVRRNGVAKRLLKRPLRDRRSQVLDVVRESFPAAVEHGRLLFMYGEEDFTFSHKVREAIDNLAAQLPPELRARYELRTLPGERLNGFETLKIQRTVIEEVVGWMVELFGPADELITADGSVS